MEQVGEGESPLHSQLLHARQPRQLRGHGAREVVVLQPPATATLQVSNNHRSTQHAGWRVARSVQGVQVGQQPHVRRYGAREVVVVQGPATTNFQVSPHHRSAQHAGGG